MLRQQWQQKTFADNQTGVAWLSDLGVLVFQGSDAAAFLQGYLTSDTDRINPAPVATALCDLRGRVVANGYVCGSATDITLLVHRSLSALVVEFLRRYMAFSKTKVIDHSDTRLVFGLVDSPSDPRFFAIDQRRGLAIACDEIDVQALVADSEVSDQGAFWTSMIEDQLALVSSLVSGQFLPQMLNLQQAVDFNKGCYLGQEIIARAQHRGQVKRQLKTVAVSGTVPSIGQTLIDLSGQKRGTVVNLQVTEAHKAILLVVTADDSDTPFSSSDASYTIWQRS